MLKAWPLNRSPSPWNWPEGAGMESVFVFEDMLVLSLGDEGAEVAWLEEF